MRKINEECGVFGIYDNDGLNVARLTYYGLYALQHRGQESSGIAVNNNGVITMRKDMGLVGDVFPPEELAKIKGTIAVGHVRYSPKSEANRENAQPLVSRYIKGSLTIAYNGCLINAAQLRSELEAKGAIFQCTNDAEVIMHMLAIARTQTHSIEEALQHVMKRLRGAYSMVLMSPRKLLAVRDPHAFRPLCIGRIKNSYIFASESCALDVTGAQFVRDVMPGEIVMLDNSAGALRSIPALCGHEPSLCVFEYVYTARPDSIIDGVSVYSMRLNAGKRLFDEHPCDADIVIGVPDSGLIFAAGFADASGIPLRDGFIKNRYTGRTFIRPSQSERETAVHIKLNALKANVMGKNIVMVDDSIVRGTTSANIIKLLKQAGAKKVHMRIASPPFINRCYYGTDIADVKDLIAVTNTVEEIRQKIGADSLGFLSLDALNNVGLRSDFGYCKACFDGKNMPDGAAD